MNSEGLTIFLIVLWLVIITLILLIREIKGDKNNPKSSRNIRKLSLISVGFFLGISAMSMFFAIHNKNKDFINQIFGNSKNKVEITYVPIFTESPQTATMQFDIGSTKVSSVDNMVMVYVPAGEFQMGSEEGDSDESPIHTVYLDAFWIDKTEVTNAEYRQCVLAGFCTEPRSYECFTIENYYLSDNYLDYPVININWEQANDYCNWVGRRLPTEAEWEKAAKGTDCRIYPWGNTLPNPNIVNSDEYNHIRNFTFKVGSYPNGASPYGVLDMAGNVAEWIMDFYNSGFYSYSPSTNPQGPETGPYHVVRGGDWGSNTSGIRTTERYGREPIFASSQLGFRCAISAE